MSCTLHTSRIIMTSDHGLCLQNWIGTKAINFSEHCWQRWFAPLMSCIDEPHYYCILLQSLNCHLDLWHLEQKFNIHSFIILTCYSNRLFWILWTRFCDGWIQQSTIFPCQWWGDNITLHCYFSQAVCEYHRVSNINSINLSVLIVEILTDFL